MTIKLENVRRVTATQPARMLVYGPAGIGKTTLASEFPDPIFLQVEDGTPGDTEIATFGQLATYGQVMEAIIELYSGEHDFQTVVLDSATEMQRLVFAETCARGDDKGVAKGSIEDFGYGKGYVYSTRIWQELVEGLNALRRDRGMMIVIIAHSTVTRFDDPETVSYDRYQIDLHKSSVGMIERDMDAIVLLKQPVTVKSEEKGFNKARSIGQGGSTVMMHAQGRPAFTAKNRYGIPATIRYERGNGFNALAPYLPGYAGQAEETATENKKDAA